MSRIKRQMEEDEARGFASTGRQVCGDCIGDTALGEVVRQAAESEPCSYCGSKPAAPLDTVLRHMLGAVRFEYRPASEESPPWDSAEGGYQAREVWFPELLYEEMDSDFGDDRVREDIEAALRPYSEPWFERDWYALRPHEQLVYSWRRFASAVQRRPSPMLRPRAAPSDDPDAPVEPEDMLDTIAGLVADLPSALRTVRVGSEVWRARPGRQRATVSELGPPPPGTAVAGGRMNRSGEIFFYGALDRETAIGEVAHKSGAKLLTVGPFRATHDLVFLDLTGAALNLPSVFDVVAQSRRVTVRFLREFARLISLPAADMHRRGYFPTQAMTAYVRAELGGHLGRRIDGILYPSARSAGSNLVLFVGADGCANEGARQTPATRLVLVAARVEQVALG